jgi:hypothetical protein
MVPQNQGVWKMNDGIPPHWHLIMLVCVFALLVGENRGDDLKTKLWVGGVLILLLVALA